MKYLTKRSLGEMRTFQYHNENILYAMQNSHEGGTAFCLSIKYFQRLLLLLLIIITIIVIIITIIIVIIIAI